MAAPNEESQQLQGLATGSQQQQDEGSIAQDIMKTVMEEQAYQDLNAKVSALEQELAKERREKEEAVASRKELGEQIRLVECGLQILIYEQLSSTLSSRKPTRELRPPMSPHQAPSVNMKHAYG
jgi:uncharacterized protein involved in type VI secretion and phage assembly